MDGESSTALGDRPRGLCAITGASGYVGSRIAIHLASVGWEVRALCRSEPAVAGPHLSHLPFDLATGPAPETLEDADVLIHAAYDFGLTRWDDIARVNIDGSRHLFAAAKDAGVDRIVCVSTVAAFPGARSMYGHAKLAIEQAALAAGAAVVRCGLVWGSEGGAMFGALRHAVDRLPVVPLVAPADLRLTLVCEDDLVVFLERLLGGWPDGSGELFVAGSEHALTFMQLLRSLSPVAGEHRRFVPVPWTVVWRGLRCLEVLGVTPPFSSDSLVSLVNLDSDPLTRATAGAERYGVTFRAYAHA